MRLRQVVAAAIPSKETCSVGNQASCSRIACHIWDHGFAINVEHQCMQILVVDMIVIGGELYS